MWTGADYASPRQPWRCRGACTHQARNVPHSVRAVFPRVTPHSLRHTAASLAVKSGANVKAVQRMLGHASAAMTLDTYADLFEDDLDDVGDALDRAATALDRAQNVPTNDETALSV